MLNSIGLSEAYAQNISVKLNILLANYSIYYMNLRGYHWNIKGDKFYELHLKFEEFYTDAQLKLDEIAERILSLGHTPLHTYSDYIKEAKIIEDKNCTDGKTALMKIVNHLQLLLILEREILKLAAEADDEGTNAQMSDYIREQEKTVWMLNSYLGS